MFLLENIVDLDKRLQIVIEMQSNIDQVLTSKKIDEILTNSALAIDRLQVMAYARVKDILNERRFK